MTDTRRVWIVVSNVSYMLGIILFKGAASLAHVIYTACGARKIIYPTSVMYVIISCNPSFRDVRYCVCGSECASQISVFKFKYA
jgi:hypothetical protein